MSEARTGQISTRAAQFYERLFVPALFGQWPAQLLGLAGVQAGETVVDVGCGTGVLARAALQRVGAGGQVVGVDPNAGMLDVARQEAPEVTWIQGVAERLPLDPASADVVAGQFALMFFTDRAAALSEMRRVLRPGGRLVIATWAALSASPGYDAMVSLLRRVAGDPAADALLVPFTIGTESALMDIVAPVFPDVQIQLLTGRARFPSIDAWLTADIKAWTLNDLVGDDQLAELHTEAPRVLGRFRAPDGTVDFAAPAVIAIAHR